MTTLICDRIETDGTLARYVAGHLSNEEAVAFEDHYLTCDRCQRSVEVANVVRTVPATTRRRKAWPVAIAMAAAASVVLFVGLRSMQNTRYRALGVVDTAPIYLGASMRAPDAGLSARFETAMRSYTAGNYPQAANELGAIEAHTSEAAVAFFHGASLLMMRDAKDASNEFTKVLESGNEWYRDEAYFYRAKAYLLQGKRDNAKADLQSVRGAIKPAATDLLQKLSK